MKTKHPALFFAAAALAFAGCSETGKETKMESPFIVAKIADCGAYAARHPRFAKAFAFLKRPDLAALAPGRYEIDGDDAWAMIQTPTLKAAGDTQHAEVHARFIDIQAPLDGPETIGLLDLGDAPRFEPFDEKQDIGFADVKTELVTLAPGDFAVLFPGRGAHAPCLTTGAPCARKKLVIKVRN